MTEHQVINAFTKMCLSSTSPGTFINLIDNIIPQLENNRSDLDREAELLDTCGICGKPLSGQPTREDVEVGTCCSEHYF